MKFSLIMRGFIICMMPEGDDVTLVGECDDSLTLWFWDWEQVLKDMNYSISKGSAKSIEYKVRVGFTHWIWSNLKIMTHNSIHYSKVQSRSKWKVAYDYTIRLSPMLMNNYQVRIVLLNAGLNQIFNYQGSSIQTGSVGEDKGQFLHKLNYSMGSITTSSYSYLWVSIDTQCILIIDNRSGD